MEELTEKKEETTSKKTNLIKLICGIVGIVVLIVFFIILAINSKHITCVTFLGNDIYVSVKNDIPQLNEINTEQLKRPGYRFVGWYQNNKFNEEYIENTEFFGKNLYAKYERVIYTIEYLTEENGNPISSDEFVKEQDYYTTTGTSIRSWHPEKFCVKNQYMDNNKYEEILNSDGFDKDAKDCYKTSNGTLYNTETDHSTFLIISSLKDPGFKGYNVYGKLADGSKQLLTGKDGKAEFNLEKSGCLINKDIISDTNYIGIVLVPYFE